MSFNVVVRQYKDKGDLPLAMMVTIDKEEAIIGGKTTSRLLATAVDDDIRRAYGEKIPP